MNDLNLENARALRALIESQKGTATNVEVLAGLAVSFLEMWLDQTIAELEKRAAVTR